MMTNIGDQFLEKKFSCIFLSFWRTSSCTKSCKICYFLKKKDILKANFSRRKTHTRWMSRSFCGASVGNKIRWIWRRLFRSQKMCNFQISKKLKKRWKFTQTSGARTRARAVWGRPHRRMPTERRLQPDCSFLKQKTAMSRYTNRNNQKRSILEKSSCILIFDYLVFLYSFNRVVEDPTDVDVVIFFFKIEFFKYFLTKIG